MSDNKLLEERKARTKQLEDMEQMHQDLLDKIKRTEADNGQIQSKIKELEDLLEVKSGKLDYILEEKEALFNKLQLAITENKELKSQYGKKTEQPKKRGMFSSLVSYFKQDNFATIDVTEGKVKKSEIEVNPKNLIKEFNNPQSFFSNNSEFDSVTMSVPNPISLPKLVIPMHNSKSEDTTMNSDEHDESENKDEEEHNVESDDNDQEAEPQDHDHESQSVEDHENLDHGNEEAPADDQSEDMLKMIRENFNILPN